MKASYLGCTLLAVIVGTASGYWFGHTTPVMPVQQTDMHSEKPALYWFDPMYPAQHFDAPGKSPFMDMALVPKYANSNQDNSSISVPAQLTQNLGMRTSPVVLERLPGGFDAVGSLAYNQREIANLQARSAGFVERVYARAPRRCIARWQCIGGLVDP